MTYRWTYLGDKTLWREMREIPGNTSHYEYRIWSDNVWCCIEYKGAETFQEIIVRCTTPGWVLETGHRMTIDPNDLFPGTEDKKVDKPIHKCYCSWNKVYQEGCQCGGI